MSVPSVEQMVRTLLERAVEDGLVDPADSQWDDPDPQSRTPDELAGVGHPGPLPARRGGGGRGLKTE
jgi:hypothetical protein